MDKCLILGYSKDIWLKIHIKYTYNGENIEYKVILYSKSLYLIVYLYNTYLMYIFCINIRIFTIIC